MIKSTISTIKNKISYAPRYNLSVHDIQTVAFITQDLWVVQIMVLLETNKGLQTFSLVFKKFKFHLSQSFHWH